MRNALRSAGLVLLAAAPAVTNPTATATATAQAPATATGQAPAATAQPVGTMSDLMVKIIYPASDAIFYITTRTPTTEAEWGELQGKALALAESANLLMMPGRARDQDRWLRDARLMLDAGRAAYRAARAKDVAGLEAVNDQLYESCTSCHQHYRPNYGRRNEQSSSRGSGASTADTIPAPPGQPAQPAPPTQPAPPAPPASPARPQEKLEGRWKLIAAEDLRADGTVARYPWGEHPIGSIVVDSGACYLQIMSSDTPSFPASGGPPTDQMKAKLLSSYIAYSGRCAIDEAAGSVTLKVEAAWRPDYVGTEQTRFFRFDNGKLLFGPTPNSIRFGSEQLTRRLTLERVR